MAQFSRPLIAQSGGWFDDLGNACGIGTSICEDRVNEVVPNDANYMHDTPLSSHSIGMSSVSDPGIDTGMTLRFRAFEVPDASPKCNFRIILQQVSPFVSIHIENYNGTLDDTQFVTYNIPIPEAEAALITDYSQLRVIVDNQFVAGSTRDVRVSWIELEVGGTPPPPSITLTGSGGLEVGGAPTLVLSADVSGMYTLIQDQRFDRVYSRNTSPNQTQDVAFPKPFGKTAYLGS